MTRLAMLRAGYAGLGIAFAALAATIVVPSLLLAGFGLAILAGVLLWMSDDELPKWAGIVILSYFGVSIIAFLLATPITINRGGERFFVNPAPPDLANEVIYWMGLVSPLVLAASGLMAVWERELPVRVLLIGALGGLILVAILSVILVPAGDGAAAAASARVQGNILSGLLVVSASAGAAGILWASSRPESL